MATKNPVSVAYFEKAPQLIWEWHWWAYRELQSEKQSDYGKIPLRAIEAFADQWGIAGYQMTTLLFVVRGLEQYHDEKRAEEIKRNQPASR